METPTRLFSLRFLYAVLGMILCFQLCSIKAEETCSWMPDGSKVCNDEEEGDSHNVWTEPLDEAEITDNDTGERMKTLKSSDTKEIEQELFVLFAGQLKDWNPEDGLSQFQPEVIVFAILNVFNSIDINDDGLLDFAEIENLLLQRKNNENLSQIKAEIDDFPENHISIFEFLSMFKKFNDGKETEPLLVPFEKLHFLPPDSAKKIIQGSVQMFIDSDQNSDSKLDKDEFFSGMAKAQEKRKEMGGTGAEATSDQLDALFKLVDKDSDEYLTYAEFQGTIPEKPKSFKDAVDEVFKDADKNSDEVLSETEFATYMEVRSKKENPQAIPTSKEVTDAFAKLDANKDDVLSVDEMMGLFDEIKKAKEQRITEAFAGFDRDADGFLSLDELKVITQAIEKNTGQNLDVNVFMTMLDKDKDRKVSLEEMTDLLTKLIK